MKKLILATLFLFLMFGCIQGIKTMVTKNTDSGSQISGEVICNEPYIRHADSCCLDQNDNQVCDSDETSQGTGSYIVPSSGGTQETPKKCLSGGQNYCVGSIRYYGAECDDGAWDYKTEHCSFGCLNGVCKSQTCPSSCNDGNPCTLDYCSSATGYACKHDALSGSQSGCSGSAGTCRKYFCDYGSCAVGTIVPCCGNGVCESTESYVSCLSDCEAPSAEIYLTIEGCDTGYDIRNGLGEVTNIYVNVQNIGDASAFNIALGASATDEGEEHPDKYALISNLPAGYGYVQKLTVDTEFKKYGTITVEAYEGVDLDSSTYSGGYSSAITSQCAEIDPATIEGLGTLIKIYSTGGVLS